MSRQTSRAILNFQIEKLQQSHYVLFGELQQVFSRVKEFNVFGSADIAVSGFEQDNDTLRLKIIKGQTVLSARVLLQGGYPKIPPLWTL